MPSIKLSPNSAGAVFALIGFAVFSTHDLIIKQLGSTYSTFQIVFYTALFSFPLLTLVMIRDHKPTTLRPVHPYWIAVRSLAGVVSGLSAFYAISTLPLSQFYAFIFASPLLITLLAIPILGETVRLRRGLAVLVGLVGVLIVIRPGMAPFTDGHIAALIAAFAGAMVSIITRKIGRDERGVVMILYPMMTNLIVTAMALPFVYIPVPLEHLGLLAVDSVLVLIAMSLLVKAYTHADAILVAPMQYSQIIWATIFGIFLFNEYPAWQTYLGTAVIALSGFYILRREATGNVSSNTPVSKTRTRIGHTMAMRVGDALRKRR
ncbi:MAG: drug/metabolite transporter (DMT)-like permease [Ascidiaceihabitans sp.]|jgi:drug/metabolite transporter (DMT)-like permease